MDQPAGLGKPRTVDLGNGAHAILDMETIGGIHAANVGLVTAAKAHVFINCGQTEAQARFAWEYAQTRAPGRDMAYLILSHHHLDHCYASSYFDDRHALIYAHKTFSECMAEMKKHLDARDHPSMLKAFLSIDDRTYEQNIGGVHPTPPHRHVGEEVSIAINGEEIVIMHLPGHTASELVVWHPRSRVLFAGDAVNEKAGPVTMFGGPKDWRRWMAGLVKLKKLDIEKIVPGHGEIAEPGILEDHIEALRKKIEESEKK